MGKRTNRTVMGGQNERFCTTSVTELLEARSLDPQRQREAVARVMTKYWRPVYAYLRRKGQGNEQAKDLTQGFFTEIVLGKELIRQADPAKGRFRTFLLTALHHYVIAQYRKERLALVSLDAFDEPPAVPAKDATPAEAFDYAWASGVLDDVLAEVHAACRQAGQETHWEVFRRTVLAPTLTGAASPSTAELCADLGIANKRRASNMCITVKRRFRSVFRAHMRRLVDSDGGVDGEIRDLIDALTTRRTAEEGRKGR